MTIYEMALRIVLAMAMGGIVGWERENNNRPAGLRTHTLVATGAAVVMLMGEMSLEKYAQITTMDPTRLGAQVISGIGFLGAGTIMREGLTVKGLTTAASLWAVACLGLAAGGGFYAPAMLGLVATIITLTAFECLEKKYRKVRCKEILIELECTDISTTLLSMKRLAGLYDIVLVDVDIAEEIGENKVIYHLRTKFGFHRVRRRFDKNGFSKELSKLNGVSELHLQELF